jgi:sestrin
MSAQGVSPPSVPRPSKMFRESVLPITTDQEPQSSIFKASFLNTGRVTHMCRIMAWHPTFLEKFTEAYDFLLRAEGPLPFSWRHYLAIVSAARFKCEYLVRQQEQEFILAGGDETWLETTQNCPAKLVRLLEANAILAHQPWRLQSTHISDLMKGVDSSSRWSTGELVQAFVILATFRALAGLAIGMGLNPEVDLNVGIDVGGYSNTRRSGSSQTLKTKGRGSFSSLVDSDEAHCIERSSDDGPSSQNEQLAGRLATRSGNDDSARGDAESRKQHFEAAGDGVVGHANGSGLNSLAPTIGGSGNGNGNGNEHEKSSSSGSNNPNAIGTSTTSSSLLSPSSDDSSSNLFFSRYTLPFDVRHTDFDVRSRDYSVFHIQDWSWEEHAYELIERTYNSDFAHLLDSEFTTIFELTYHQVNGQKGVDTAPFRRSVWYYVHRIHGILHDDYNYATVNELLLRNLKKFTKDLSCTPFAVTPQDLLNLGYSLSPEEKCHIALLATEARKQAELMYSLYALSRHLASS